VNANCAGCTRTISTVRHGTEQNKADLTVCGENTLLARETHLIGIRFKNDTERLERLFELYTKMTTAGAKVKPQRKTAKDTVRRLQANPDSTDGADHA
jgi:hypothetical protein